MLITLLKHADRVKIACMAQLVNVIAPIMTEAGGGGAWRQTIFYPFLHASKYGRGTVLQPLINSEKHGTKGHGEVTDIESVAVYHEGKDEVTVFAVNRNLEEDVHLTADMRGMPGYQVLEHIVLEHSDLKAVNGPGAEQVAPRTAKQSRMEGGILESVLHKASWNVIRLGAKQ